jgi:hypothetical protein
MDAMTVYSEEKRRPNPPIAPPLDVLRPMEQKRRSNPPMPPSLDVFADSPDLPSQCRS